MKRYIIGLFIIAILITGCSPSGNNSNSLNGDDKYRVVTTTTMIADLAKVIGGEYVEVQGLMGPGIDPHLYKASAGDVSLMQKSDMILYNGLHLEGKMGDVLEKLNDSGKLVVALSDGIHEEKLLTFEEGSNIYDPHIWFDIALWKQAAVHVTEGFKTLDEKHSDQYDANLKFYLDELDKLHEYINQRAAELPKEKRVLITAHDAFNYFGKAYGFEVKGLQGISTDSEAGTSDLRELANYIVDHKIKAIFIETSVPHKNIEALQEAVRAKGFEVKIGGELYSDSTGNPGTEAETYIGTLKGNIDTIVNALK